METIKSERLFLRKLVKNDITDEVMEWFEDDELMKYYTNSKIKITKEILIQSINDGESAGTSFTYGIFFTESDKLIGTIKVGPINLAHKISDLVVLIGDKNYHGKGLAVDAIKLGNRLAFETYGIRKLFGGMYASNISSIKAYTRAGWIVEGKLIGHYWVNNKNEDRIVVGCFNPDYFKTEEIENAKDSNWYSINS